MNYRRSLCLLALPLLLVSCETPQDELLGSRLVQPPKGSPIVVPDEVGDLALAGSNIAQAVRTLPEILAAPKPPIIQLQGVTSIVINGPIDTEPYANLLRDRLNAGDDNKVHYMERQLPQLHHEKRERSDDDLSMSPDYQLFAELQGNAKKPVLTLQVQLVNVHTQQVAYDHRFHISQEAPSTDAPGGGYDADPNMQTTEPAPTPGSNPYEPVVPAPYSPAPPAGVQ